MNIPEEATGFWGQVIGLKISALVAGSAGALVSLLYEKEMSTKRAIVLLAAGTATAGYVTPLVVHMLGMGVELGNALSFLLGLTSMKIVGTLLNALSDAKAIISILLFLKRK